jgi:hypothetical protein
MNLCKYKNIFGEPNTGIHSYRLFGFAIVDCILTIIGGILIAYFTGIPYWMGVLLFFISGIIIHRLFCVRTTIDKLLFTDKNTI